MSDNLYERLGVAKDADRATIRKAFKRLASKHHPDKNDDSVESKELFQSIMEAYETLSDADRRAHYDETGSIKKGVSNEKQQCLQTLHQVFSQMLTQSNYHEMDYPKELGNFVKRGIKQLAAQKSAREAELKKMQNLKERLKGPLYDMHLEVLKSKQVEAERQWSEAVKESTLMFELIDDLKYCPPEDVGLIRSDSVGGFSSRFVGFDGRRL